MTANLHNRAVGMGPISRQKPKWKKCSEFFVLACEGDTPDCCRTLPCRLCIEFDVYGEEVYRSVLEWDGARYTGSLSGVPLRIEWTSYTECTLEFYANDELILEVSQCDEYGTTIDCRLMATENTVTIAFKEGTLKTYAMVPFETERTKEYGESCESKDFCTDCSCAPKIICATLIKCDCYTSQVLDFTGNPCGSNNYVKSMDWYGEIECVDSDDPGIVTFEITADPSSNECIFSASIDGLAFADIPASAVPWTGCGPVNITYTWWEDGRINYLLIQGIGSCEETCRSNQCWQEVEYCLEHGTKSNCCNEEIPKLWIPTPGWFDPVCSIEQIFALQDLGAVTCPVPYMAFLSLRTCDEYATGQYCEYLGDGIGNGVDPPGDEEWVLRIDGDDSFLNHTATGRQFIVRPEFPWNDLCQNMLFREDMCDITAASCTDLCPADYVCLYPTNQCVCDENSPQGLDPDRPALPDTLSVTITTIDCGVFTGSAIWNPFVSGWEVVGVTLPGAGAFCQGSFDLLLSCPGVQIPFSDEEYELTVSNTVSPVGDLTDPVRVTSVTSCYPFMRQFTMFYDGEFAPDTMTVTFLEVL